MGAVEAGGYKNLIAPDRKLRIACVGCGGKGASDINDFAGEEIVALCDVDYHRGATMFMLYPDAIPYRDYRKMLVEVADKIDAVSVSVPDHTHYPAARLAMELGKHVFIQKPLTHTVGEARALKKLAIETGVVTQMGNQGHAREETRLCKEWIDAGVIGKVAEVHIWTDRPRGMWVQPSTWINPHPVPEGLDWNLWCGVAPYRDYAPNILPFIWRSFWSFGSGTLGDMGCHTMDTAFWALNLRGPMKVSAEVENGSLISAPGGSRITYEFAATPERGAVKMIWYDGTYKAPVPKEFDAGKFPTAGCYFVGEKGILLAGGDFCETLTLLPVAKMKEFLPHRPPKVIPRVPHANPALEWIAACKGGPKPGSNIIDHSADLTEMVQLGNVAIRMSPRVIDWDPVSGTCIGLPEADGLIHKKYRLF